MFTAPPPFPINLSPVENEFFDDVFAKIWNAYMVKYDQIVSNLNVQKVILRKFYFEVKSKSYISEYDKLTPEQFLTEIHADVLRCLTFKGTPKYNRNTNCLELGKKYYLQLGETLSGADAPVFVFLHLFRSFGESFFQDHEATIRKVIVLMLANTHEAREIEDILRVNRKYLQEIGTKNFISHQLFSIKICHQS